MKQDFDTIKRLSPNVEGLRPSATLLINERSKALIAEGKTVYKLGFGQSPFPVPPSVVKALQENAFQKDYLPVRGLPALREAVATFNNRTLGITCDAAQIMIGPGSKELIYSLQLAFNGDLLLPSPSWVSYEPQAHLTHKKVHWLPTSEEDNWKITPDTVDRVGEKSANPNRLLILNYPNNPVGNTYSSKELQELAAAFRRNNILVVADEIYGEVDHNGTHCSLAQHYPEGTVISGGLSKWCGAGGWRLGTFTFPKEQLYLLDAMATIASETFSAVSAPIQHAAVTAFLGNPAIDSYVRKSRIILQKIGQYVYQELKELNITMPEPQGGFYLFPNFEYYRELFHQKGIYNSTDLCERLLEETGVALLPGVAFGRPTEELTARLSFVDFDGEKALAEFTTTLTHQEFINNYSPNISKAMQALRACLDQ